MKVTTSRPLVGPYSVKRSTGLSSAAPILVSDTAPAGDVTSILGIPEAEFTPRVRAAIMTLMAEVDRLRQELDKTRQQLDDTQAQADQDVLLPILNRRAFVREMSRMMAFAERYQVPVAMIYLDLNGFKAINDAHGHAAGDAALSHVCGVLIENLRESDVLGRLGGDEFGVILAKADLETAHRKARVLNDNLVADPFRWKGQPLSLSFAHGAYLLEAGQSAVDAISAADQAMYSAKRAKSGQRA